MGRMSVDEKRRGVGSRTWYHMIDLGDGVRTVGQPYMHLWDNVRKVRERIDYKGKRVLDVASWDGMWAFEAERLGASGVVASDVSYDALGNFLFCREALGSGVLPMYGVAVEELEARLGARRFDIVQHLGLLYHVEGPTLGLRQCQKVLVGGGTLLMESAVARTAGAADYQQDDAFAVFNHGGPDKSGFRVYAEPSTWWVPSLRCLEDMLRTCGFDPDMSSCSVIDHPFHIDPNYVIGRACLVCRVR
jgi:SAM-dependent methyltransferase